MRNTWLSYLKKNRHTVNLENPEAVMAVSEQDEPYSNDLSEKIEELMERIGEPCRKVLKYYYYDKLSMKQICEKMEFVSEKSAKTQKYKCLKILIELINSKPGLKELLLELS